MPHSRYGKKREPVDANALKNALKAINSNDPEKKMSYGKVVKVISVSHSTLTRHLNKFLGCRDDFEYSVNYSVKMVFSEHGEICLVKYIETVAKMQYRLTKKGVRQLVYKFSKANGKKYPKSWDEEQRGMDAQFS